VGSGNGSKESMLEFSGAAAMTAQQEAPVRS
jgi:hypothetical protein